MLCYDTIKLGITIVIIVVVNIMTSEADTGTKGDAEVLRAAPALPQSFAIERGRV